MSLSNNDGCDVKLGDPIRDTDERCIDATIAGHRVEVVRLPSGRFAVYNDGIARHVPCRAEEVVNALAWYSGDLDSKPRVP